MRSKDSCPVWGEGAGKVPDGNSPTPYSTSRPVLRGRRGASPLRYSTRGRFRARGRCPALPGRDARALGGVCADVAPGQDPPDRVWPLRGGPARPARARQTGDVLLPGVHPHLRAVPPGRGLGKPETFCFLGFTHICGRSRRGTFQLQRRVKDVLRRRMHQPIPVQGRWLTQVVNGYFAYHAVPTNRRALMAFRHHVTDLWRRTLRRRSQKDRFTWARMAKVADAWLPRPYLLHPWPSERFAVRHPRWEPSARIGPARICAGGAQ